MIFFLSLGLEKTISSIFKMFSVNINTNKCLFGEGIFHLGFSVSQRGIEIDPSKALVQHLQVPPPTNEKEIR